MFPYYLLFFAITLIYLCLYTFPLLTEQQKDNYFFFILLVLLSCFVGLRDCHVGVDTLQYSYLYDIVSYTVSYGREISEWGFFRFLFISRYWLGLNFQGLLFILGALNIVALMFNLRRYCNNMYVGIIIYLALGLFAMNLSGMRQSFAMAICFLSILFIEKRKLILSFLLMFIAFTIHNSAIIFLPVYFLWGVKINRFQGFILLVCVLLAFVYRIYLNPVIEFLAPLRYANMDLLANYNINILVILVPICLTVFSLCLLPGGTNHKFSNINSFFYIFSCLYIWFLILSINNNQIGRLSYYFALGNMVTFPAALKNLYARSRFLAIFTGVCAVSLFFVYFFISTPGGVLQIDKYQLFFM